MDSYQKVVSRLHGAAVLTGMTPETRIIGVADGGVGLSEELRRHFPNMRFILDRTHLKDHLYDTAEKMGIPKKERAKWVEPRIAAISKGYVDKTMEELKEEYEKNPSKRLKRLIRYLDRFRDALNYNSFKDEGYPIGSGEIEIAHKSIPQKRLKIPGASWRHDSINPMLALRILRADDWWDDFWNQRTKKLLAA